MKFSEMSTEKVSDILCEIVPYVENIVKDESLMTALKDKVPQGASSAEIYAHSVGILTKIIPIFIKSHRDDVFSILSIVFDKEKEEIASQNILKTISQIKEIISDKDLFDFFK